MRQARLKEEQQARALDSTINQTGSKIDSAEKVIQQKREGLEEARKEGNLSEEAYKEREEKIKRAEQALGDLKEKTKKREKIKQQGNQGDEKENDEDGEKVADKDD